MTSTQYLSLDSYLDAYFNSTNTSSSSVDGQHTLTMPTTHTTTSSPSTTMPTLARRLSLEETFNLADHARKHASDRFVREDLRLKLGHTNILDSLLRDIARRSPPPSPTQSVCRPHLAVPKRNYHQLTAGRRSAEEEEEEDSSKSPENGTDDYGFDYHDDGEEDVESLSLTRTKSRKPEP